ncbi:phage major capsid protein [Qipengyuania nanhaisediminis]|uniref:Phage major capsid protein, HK97 family n=1 Tax=Qipengyuania nanhaisediminis TaxID=604088 RepID=A0A1I5L9Y6_9SPHN|nr:phage major capsid protein [Qipengyuania nanhaisediminis]SFO94174.1 phage major capsid protein, HK97 family [Qipengyuania nanhaisediminis]
MTLQTKTAAELANEVKASIDNRFRETNSRLNEMEQKYARSGPSGDYLAKSWGEQIAESDQVKALSEVKESQPGRVRLEVKDITSAAASGGAFADPMRENTPNLIARRTPRIRDLLTVVNTSNGSVDWVNQTTRTNNAATQAEGALKAESDYAFELLNLPMRTIAHWTKASVQILDDSPQLASVIDNELRFGLALAEDAQLLNGDGVSPNLDGLITNATAYSAEFAPASENMIDKIALAALQVSLADYEPNGVAVHPSDWMRMRLLKDGDGKYILGDPQASVAPNLFGLPVVPTTAISVDKFLVGDFARAATLYDRQAPTVQLSTEDGDNFVRNLVTIRCESRLGIAIRNPTALSFGDFGNVA